MDRKEGDKRQGGCACGAVRYEIDGAGAVTGLCHCDDCRASSGAAFQSWTNVPVDQLVYISAPTGVLKRSPFAQRRFCEACGTPIEWFALIGPGKRVSIATYTLDNPNGISPSQEEFADRRPRWLPEVAGAQQIAALDCGPPPDLVAEFLKRRSEGD